MSETGDRIISGSRRPDGTYRKDVRVRAGYVPQDEQQVYQSKGALARQGVPKVPGLDDSGKLERGYCRAQTDSEVLRLLLLESLSTAAEVEAAKRVAQTKSARKNDKRKQKKAAGKDSTACIGDSIASVGSQLAATRLSSEDPSPSKCTAAPSAAHSGTSEATSSSTDKRKRAIRKKLKQVEMLNERRRAGAALTTEEMDKLKNADSWRASPELPSSPKSSPNATVFNDHSRAVQAEGIE